MTQAKTVSEMLDANEIFTLPSNSTYKDEQSYLFPYFYNAAVNCVRQSQNQSACLGIMYTIHYLNSNLELFMLLLKLLRILQTIWDRKARHKHCFAITDPTDNLRRHILYTSAGYQDTYSQSYNKKY